MMYTIENWNALPYSCVYKDPFIYLFNWATCPQEPQMSLVWAPLYFHCQVHSLHAMYSVLLYSGFSCPHAQQQVRLRFYKLSNSTVFSRSENKSQEVHKILVNELDVSYVQFIDCIQDARKRNEEL